MSEELDRIQPGEQVGPYRIVRGLKKGHVGGMARIFEAEVREKYRRPGLPRRLALKIAKPEHQAALTAEADYLSRFNHPNVVRIFPLPLEGRSRYAAREKFSFGWGWYYAMELLDGGSLRRRLTRPTTVTDLLRLPPEGERRLSLLETLGVACQLAAALEHIHERHVVNLDVKPGNVLFRRRRFRYLRGSIPQAALCDFGISRDIRYPRAGLLGVATPEYVSPEQVSEIGRRPRPVDARSDIFSLGVVLYEMLTGTVPFENIALAADPAYAPLSPRQLRPAVPPALEEIVMRALAKDPVYRYQTAAEMQTALKRAPTPLDWGATARRTFAGVTLAAGLAAGGLGVSRCWPPPTVTPVPTLTPVSVTVAPPSPTVTLVPTIPPATEQRPTSTPKPTLVPTRTPRPSTPTLTPTPTPGG